MIPSAQLLDRATSSHQKFLIYADTLGLLNHLVATGRLSMHVNECNDGAALYLSTEGPTA